MAKIRTEISIESSEILTIRRNRYSVRTLCEDCKRISMMVLPSEAAFLSCRGIDSIISLMYGNRIHIRYIETKGLYICLTSLCLYGFENDFAEPEFENELESVRILKETHTNEFGFIYEE